MCIKHLQLSANDSKQNTTNLGLKKQERPFLVVVPMDGYFLGDTYCLLGKNGQDLDWPLAWMLTQHKQCVIMGEPQDIKGVVLGSKTQFSPLFLWDCSVITYSMCL
jgi:hypothetical protein